MLVLGGTVFLGRHLVSEALRQGHEVTLFNRGRQHPELFGAVEKLRGDRDGDLQALTGRRFDAVIDTSGFFPRVVARTLEALGDAFGHYTFISSISAYAACDRPGIDETAPLAELPPQADEDISRWYGPLKAGCERLLEQRVGDRLLTIRPGLIVGPYDPTDRFTYWPARMAQGGRVLAPGRPGQPVQVIDVRDLARWIVALVEEQVTGAYHVSGPASPLTLGEMLETTAKAMASDARLVWVDEDFLEEQAVEPWIEMPLWLPRSHRDATGLMAVDLGRALGAGLQLRPLTETVRDAYAWYRLRGTGLPRAGMDRARETLLLPRWERRGAE